MPFFPSLMTVGLRQGPFSPADGSAGFFYNFFRIDLGGFKTRAL
jgi:hypothetical protein